MQFMQCWLNTYRVELTPVRCEGVDDDEHLGTQAHNCFSTLYDYTQGAKNPQLNPKFSEEAKSCGKNHGSSENLYGFPHNNNQKNPKATQWTLRAPVELHLGGSTGMPDLKKNTLDLNRLEKVQYSGLSSGKVQRTSGSQSVSSPAWRFAFHVV